jgi:pimeloyl-ACP methyl ester carboxylesterase
MHASPVQLNDTVAGEGPPLVVLHGLYGAGNNWGRHVKWLAQHWQVHTPDLRNHGHSPHNPVMSYEAMAADIVALMDRAGHEDAVILGHSMGGKVAMTLALTEPERVRGLVIADIAPVSYEHDLAYTIRAMESVDLTQVASRRDADAQLAEQLSDTALRQFLLTNLERGDNGWQWRIPLHHLADNLGIIQGFPAFQGQWNGATLALYGEHSDYVNDPAHQQRIRDHFPRADLEAVPGAGHFLHVEAPDRFQDQLGNWLARQRE